MRFRHAIAATAFIVAGAVQASPTTLRLSGFAIGNAAVDTSMTGVVGAGELRGLLTMDGNTTGNFLTYCTDLFQSFRWNVTMTDYALVANGSAHGLTSGQADLLGKLYTEVGTVGSKDASVAFQLAVWEIVNETAAARDVLQGAFTVDAGASATQLALANGWLATITGPGAARAWTAQRLYSPTTQDFVIFSAYHPPLVPNALAVPEPASAGLAGLALGALAWLRRGAKRRADQV